MSKQEIPVNLCPDCGWDMGILGYALHEGSLGCIERQLQAAEDVIRAKWAMSPIRGRKLHTFRYLTRVTRDTIRKVLQTKRRELLDD